MICFSLPKNEQDHFEALDEYGSLVFSRKYKICKLNIISKLHDIASARITQVLAHGNWCPPQGVAQQNTLRGTTGQKPGFREGIEAKGK